MSRLKVETNHPTEDDIQWITQSMEAGLVSPFQTLNVKQLFEITPWSLITRHNDENRGYIAFLNYPIQDHYSSDWYQAVQDRWDESQYYGVKSMFLHFMVCESNIKSFLKDMIKVTFWSLSSLEWCCILAEKSKELDPEIQEMWQRDKYMENDDFQFWSIKRDLFIPKVGIRSKRSEDYLELKNLFSQMYGPFKKDNLQKFTLDFLQYGEDSCPTYKYFTYDDDNTYIGIADNEKREAIGFIYATIQRVDLDLMNNHFQLESVNGLRKRHPTDKTENGSEENMSESDESSDEEYEVRELVTSLIDETVIDFEILMCVNDILDEVCDGSIPRHIQRKQTEQEIRPSGGKTFMNSFNFDLSNSKHLSLITNKNIKNFTENTLTRLVNSSSFDTTNDVHMKLVPRLGKAIQNINLDRLKQILNSEIFDPSLEEFAAISTLVMSHMPEHKLKLFQKSLIGSNIYEKLMYKKTEAKKEEISKVKKKQTAPKLSFKDTQIILHYAKSLKRQESSRKEINNENETLSKNLEYFHYRNMGFISGLTVRGQYRIQRNCLIPKIKDPFGYEEKQESENKQTNPTSDMEAYEKYFDAERVPVLQQPIPTYNGGTNCFYVEQFAIEQDYESQSLSLIQAAFAYFPRVDYSMLLLPYGSRQVPYLRRYFSTIPARPFSAHSKELYVFHKAAFCRSYSVKIYEDKFKGVDKLIACSCLKEYLLKDLESSLTAKDKEIQSVVLLSEGQVFGVVIIKELKEVEVIRRNYDVSDRINMKYHKYRSQGLLLHCVIHPIFKYFSNIFLNEAMRLCQKSILYYKIYPTHMIPYDPSAWQSLCNVLEYLSPLKPVKKSTTKAFIVLHSKEDSEITKKNSNDENKYYSLSFTCTKLILKDNNRNSSRLVVIGDSNLALGILESLVYRTDHKYTNIAIISKNGIKGEFKLDAKCYSFLPVDTDYTKSRLDGLCLPVWITVIRGEVISIKKNFLRLRDLSANKPKPFSVGYDYLVICCDLEFQTLYAKKSKEGQNRKGKEQQFYLLKELTKETYVVGKNPSNVFAVNNAEEVAKVLNWLWRYFLKKVESRSQTKKKYKNLAEMERDKKEGRIVIYGNFLEAYSALAVIIAENFPLSKVTFIKGPSSASSATFNAEILEEAVDYVIKESGLDMITNATIEYDKEVDEVVNLDVKTEMSDIRLDCCALLMFNEKKINYNTFRTLHRSSLSFSLPMRESKGHPYLLINGKFQTNIENIFAAGTATEMHTKYGSCVRFEDCAFNGRELGIIVGENLSKAMNANLDTLKDLLPVLSCPIITYVKLPCEYFYIFITNPTTDFMNTEESKKIENHVKCLVLGNLNGGAGIIPAVPSLSTQEEIEAPAEFEDTIGYTEFAQEMEEVAQEEVEEPPEEIKINRTLTIAPEYFALKFHENETVTSIECLTKMDIDVTILKRLYGIHVSQLYKAMPKIKDKTSEKLSFHLTEEWILPLDYIMFEHDNLKTSKTGYEGYWRSGYPEDMETRLNGFLDSFVDYKGDKKN